MEITNQFSWRVRVARDTFTHQGLCPHRPLNKNIFPYHPPLFLATHFISIDRQTAKKQ